MAKDYTKYNVEGIGENFSKSGLVKAIVTDYAKKNKTTYASLLKVFPDELQGKSFVVKKLSEVKIDKKKYEGRYFEKDPITLSDKEVVVVCNQWGANNIQPFIDKAESLGYILNAVKKEEPINEEIKEDSNNINQETNYGSGKLQFTISGGMFYVYYCQINKKRLQQINRFLELTDDFSNKLEFLEATINNDSAFADYEDIIEKEGLDMLDSEMYNYYSDDVDQKWAFCDDNFIKITLDDKEIYKGEISGLNLFKGTTMLDLLDNVNIEEDKLMYAALEKHINSFNLKKEIEIKELDDVMVTDNGFLLFSDTREIIDINLSHCRNIEDFDEEGLYNAVEYMKAIVTSDPIDVTNFKMKDLIWERNTSLDEGIISEYTFCRIFHVKEGEIEFERQDFNIKSQDIELGWPGCYS